MTLVLAAIPDAVLWIGGGILALIGLVLLAFISQALQLFLQAALSGAPCAALSYDPKVAAAAADLGCPCQSLDTAPASDLQAAWACELDRPPALARLQTLRRQTDVHRQLLGSLGRPACES